jgi:O-antigen ligase
MLIALFLAVFFLSDLSPQYISAREMRNAAKAIAFGGLFLSLAILWLLRQGWGGFRWIEFLVLAFLAVALISTLNHGDKIGGGLIILAGFAGAYLMAFHLTTSARPAQTIALWTWSLLAVFAGVVVLSLAFTLRNPAAFPDNRFQGITGNPNTLGGIAAVLVTGAVARSMERGASYRLGWFLLGLVGGVGLFLTQSRTAIFSSVAGLIVVAFLRRSWLLLLGLVLVVGLYVGASSASTTFSLREYVELDVGVREVGFETRTAVWMEQLNIWLDEPWLGQGLQIDIVSGQGRKGAEGGYLELLGGVGILGTVPFLLFVLIAATRLARWARRIEGGQDLPWEGYHLASVGIVIALLLHGVGEDYLSAISHDQTIYFWMLLGAACGLPLARPIAPESDQLLLKKRSAERAIAAV